MSTEKAARSFIQSANDRRFHPYQFANLVKEQGQYAGAMLHKVSVAWFLLNEIDYRYGIGDPMTGEMAARIVHEVLADYDELPDYQPMRGFENTGGDTSRTWESSKPSVPPSFIRSGAS